MQYLNLKMKLLILMYDRIIKVKAQRFKVPEILFNSYLYKKKVMEFKIDIEKELYKNIFLSGGNIIFKGFHEKLKIISKMNEKLY